MVSSRVLASAAISIGRRRLVKSCVDRRKLDGTSYSASNVVGVAHGFLNQINHHRSFHSRGIINNESEAPTDDNCRGVKSVTLSKAADAPDEEDGRIPGTRPRAGSRQLAMVFTCSVCDTRSVKQFTERSYTQGVVMVQCSGCQNWHVLADNLGYFGDDHYSVESLQNVAKVGADGVMEVDAEALIGESKLQNIASSQSADTPSSEDKEDAFKD